MELGSILHFVENKTILITGATGFLAKIKVEKILVEKIQILQNEIIGKDLFRLLKENLGPNFNSFIAQKLTLVPEDISHQDLGLDSHSIFKQQIYHQTHAIINLATTTNVDERYDISFGLNTFGVKHIINLSKKCTKLEVCVHISIGLYIYIYIYI
ncbi:alcohol-forming fatty acyl-CoA reductase-like [Arachis duranensis]|uniref:Fatty acyl-CoA reductase n=1 Tax=Arachis duranensis TaxID=130453 RepID=A0A9C6TSU9_ARADU|nr:alcohol-forming fatty acyl-CoA reductase-like [Arachis duranensis]